MTWTQSLAFNTYVPVECCDEVQIDAFQCTGNVAKRKARYTKLCNVSQSDRLPKQLELARHYALMEPPPGSTNIGDWLCFGLKEPDNVLIITSSIFPSRSVNSTARHYTLFTPSGLSSVVHSDSDHKSEYSEVFASNLYVTCIPIDIDADIRIEGGDGLIESILKYMREFMQDEMRQLTCGTFTNLDDWPMYVYKSDTNEKLSLHMYQHLPCNVVFENINEVKHFVDNVKKRAASHPVARNILQVEYTQYKGEKYIKNYVTGQFECRDDATKTLKQEQLAESNVLCQEFIDSAICAPNKSLRLPFCYKRTSSNGTAHKKLRPLTTVCNNPQNVSREERNSVISALVHYPHNTGTLGVSGVKNLILLRYTSRQQQQQPQQQRSYVYSDITCVSESEKESLIQQIITFLRRELVVVINNWTPHFKFGRYLYFNTDEKFCPRVGYTHKQALQYFKWDHHTRKLSRGCWASKCKGVEFHPDPCLAFQYKTKDCGGNAVKKRRA